MTIFWNKDTTFRCEDCGYEAVEQDLRNLKSEYSEEIGTFMDFLTCPQCGKKAIVLW